MTYLFKICRYVSNTKRTKAQNFFVFSPGIAVAFAQFIEARYEVENEDVVVAASTGDAPTTSDWSKILLRNRVRLTCILEVWRYLKISACDYTIFISRCIICNVDSFYHRVDKIHSNYFVRLLYIILDAWWVPYRVFLNIWFNLTVRKLYLVPRSTSTLNQHATCYTVEPVSKQNIITLLYESLISSITVTWRN